MNYILLFVLLLFISITSMIDFKGEPKIKKEKKEVPKEIKKTKQARISPKKKKFYSLLVPAVDRAHSKLMDK